MATGHYESWFQRANDPSGRRAFWIRYTIFAPRGRPDDAVGELWAIAFDREGRRDRRGQAGPPDRRRARSRATGSTSRSARRGSTTARCAARRPRTATRSRGTCATRGGQPPLLFLPERLYTAPVPQGQDAGRPPARAVHRHARPSTARRSRSTTGSAARTTTGAAATPTATRGARSPASTRRPTLPRVLDGAAQARPGVDAADVPGGAAARRRDPGVERPGPRDPRPRPLRALRLADRDLRPGGRARDPDHRRPGRLRRAALRQPAGRREDLPQLEDRALRGHAARAPAPRRCCTRRARRSRSSTTPRRPAFSRRSEHSARATKRAFRSRSSVVTESARDCTVAMDPSDLRVSLTDVRGRVSLS